MKTSNFLLLPRSTTTVAAAVVVVVVAVSYASTATAMTMATTLTYKLGRSLYIPMTSRCNSKTLPELRGEGFMLPAHIVAALCRIRDLEQSTQAWSGWCNYLDTQDGGKFQLPPRPATEAQQETRHQPPPEEEQEQSLVKELFREVQDYCSSIVVPSKETEEDDAALLLESIVFSGEGEPTCRWDDLLELASMIRDDEIIQKSMVQNNNVEPSTTLRLTTNGLVSLPPSPSSTTINISAPQLLYDSGITHVSVALMTHDPDQYNELVQPIMLDDDDVDNSNDGTKKPHDMVCKFIEESVQVDGLEVEVTGVDYDSSKVDKTRTEALAVSLGVDNPMRWRPYFP
mmetsp:Transcript_30062/g.73021  ORF Transcript_30062/g.73021 Transcript_30062/m.73021 type:complete len:343 (-) Transcript_30062:113-1141(-)